MFFPARSSACSFSRNAPLAIDVPAAFTSCGLASLRILTTIVNSTLPKSPVLILKLSQIKEVKYASTRSRMPHPERVDSLLQRLLDRFLHRRGRRFCQGTRRLAPSSPTLVAGLPDQSVHIRDPEIFGRRRELLAARWAAKLHADRVFRLGFRLIRICIRRCRPHQSTGK